MDSSVTDSLSCWCGGIWNCLLPRSLQASPFQLHLCALSRWLLGLSTEAALAALLYSEPLGLLAPCGCLASCGWICAAAWLRLWQEPPVPDWPRSWDWGGLLKGPRNCKWWRMSPEMPQPRKGLPVLMVPATSAVRVLKREGVREPRRPQTTAPTPPPGSVLVWGLLEPGAGRARLWEPDWWR